MSFLSNVHTYGTLHFKQPTVKADPIATMRKSFTANAKKQINAITTMESLGRKGWFSALPEGKLSVSLRNGITTMKLDGDNTHVVVDSSAVAVDFYNAAVAACAAGELDDLFMNTRPAPRKKTQ